MRIRTVKPEWMEDERLLEAGSDARVLSITLILMADDSGRGRLGKSTPARVFPCDVEAFEPAFAALSPWFARSYVVRGQRYFEIANWSKHQKIDRPSKAITPCPSEGVYDDENGAILATDSRECRETLARCSTHENTKDMGSRDTRETLATDRDLDPDLDPDRDRATRGRPTPMESFLASSTQPPSDARLADSLVAAFDRSWKSVHRKTLGVTPKRERQRTADLLAWARDTDPSDPVGVVERAALGAANDSECVKAGNPWAWFCAKPGKYLDVPASENVGTDEGARINERVRVTRANAHALAGLDGVREARAAHESALADLRAYNARQGAH